VLFAARVLFEHDSSFEASVNKWRMLVPKILDGKYRIIVSMNFGNLMSDVILRS
jgi:hypothetical protein